ncbi:Peptidyl-prolyl cis-trans isomerase [Diplonema papillatum]|nr:Peptidyl-prolyl cis-trans isomerase [Diplonema papillatum]
MGLLALIVPLLAVQGAQYSVVLYTDVLIDGNATEQPVVIEVTRSLAPHAADRFIDLVTAGYFNGAAFYRVLDTIVQFGVSADPHLTARWDVPIEDDMDFRSNAVGTVSFVPVGRSECTTHVAISLEENVVESDASSRPFGLVVRGLDALKNVVNPGSADVRLYAAKGGQWYSESHAANYIRSAAAVGADRKGVSLSEGGVSSTRSAPAAALDMGRGVPLWTCSVAFVCGAAAFAVVVCLVFECLACTRCTAGVMMTLCESSLLAMWLLRLVRVREGNRDDSGLHDAFGMHNIRRSSGIDNSVLEAPLGRMDSESFEYNPAWQPFPPLNQADESHASAESGPNKHRILTSKGLETLPGGTPQIYGKHVSRMPSYGRSSTKSFFDVNIDVQTDAKDNCDVRTLRRESTGSLAAARIDRPPVAPRRNSTGSLNSVAAFQRTMPQVTSRDPETRSSVFSKLFGSKT